MTEQHVPNPDVASAELLHDPMTRALLQEIVVKLTALTEQRQSDRIDLRRLPLPTGALAALRIWLGRGEVEATVNALGTTTISETSFAGIWWIQQTKSDGAPVGESLEFALCPRLLMTEPSDVEDALDRLLRRTNSLAATSTSDPGVSTDSR